MNGNNEIWHKRLLFISNKNLTKKLFKFSDKKKTQKITYQKKQFLTQYKFVLHNQEKVWTI